jgi:uncharacterized membrane protein
MAPVTREYVWLKVAHLVVAIVALGTSACLGILVERFGNDSVHGAFVLRTVRRLTYVVVVPGYALMAVTGLWLAHLSWSLALGWIQAALALWCAGAVLLGLSAASLRRASLAARVYGGGFGLVIVAIVYLMVAKP